EKKNEVLFNESNILRNKINQTKSQEISLRKQLQEKNDKITSLEKHIYELTKERVEMLEKLNLQVQEVQELRMLVEKQQSELINSLNQFNEIQGMTSTFNLLL